MVKVVRSRFNVVCGLRFFYHITLKRDRTTFTIPAPRQSGKLPVVLSRDEVQRLISHATNLRHRTMTHDDVCRRPALERSAAPARARHRFRADDDSGGPRQGRQGSVYAPVGAFTRGLARLLASRAATGLAVSGAQGLGPSDGSVDAAEG